MPESTEEVNKKQANACTIKSEIMPESTEEVNYLAYNYGKCIQALPSNEEVIESEICTRRIFKIFKIAKLILNFNVNVKFRV